MRELVGCSWLRLVTMLYPQTVVSWILTTVIWASSGLSTGPTLSQSELVRHRLKSWLILACLYSGRKLRKLVWLTTLIYQEVIPNWNYDQVREKKWNNSAKSGKPLEAYREEELSEMKRNIFENNWGFKEKRENFVFKKPSSFVQKNLLPQWPA